MCYHLYMLRQIKLKVKFLIKDIIVCLRYVNYLLYAGSRFACPCCNGHFRKMQPYKAYYYVRGKLADHYTPNAICPVCASSIRHRFLLTFLLSHTNILKSKIKLLHFSPQVGIYKFIKRQKNVEYIIGDIDPSRYGGTRKVDITNISFPANSFDAVLVSHVLEHIKDDAQAISELYRVIKPGGWALIAVPIYGNETYEDTSLDFKGREKMYGMGDHMRANRLDFKQKLSKAGFRVDIYTFDNVPGNYVDRSVNSPHIESDKYLFFCKK